MIKFRFVRHVNSLDGTILIFQNAIDLDQAEMEKQLGLATPEGYSKALDIYRDGAFSKSFATVKLNQALSAPLNDGTPVIGKNGNGIEVAGKVLGNFPVSSTEINVQYQTNSIQSNYVGCQVGANPTPNTEGCFAASGDLVIEGEGTFGYTYNPLVNNGNKRTLQGFSTQAEDKMAKCDNCPYVTYDKFYKYYGEYDYANQWVLAAFNGERTQFAKGNADFRSYDYVGKTGTI